jgi:AcrR family transcriptional regulator
MPMGAPRGDSEQTKTEIIAAALPLFAQRGILAVSVRDIAKSAGVTHGLVHHYFGTKEHLVEEVIRSAIASNAAVLAANPITASPDSRDVMRRLIRHFLTEGRNMALLIAHAELTGFEPEKLLPPGTVTSVGMIAKRFAELQAETQPKGPHIDPALASVYLGAAMFGLIVLHPWLLTSAGLPAEDYERRLDELVETALAFIELTLGMLPQQE